MTDSTNTTESHQSSSNATYPNLTVQKNGDGEIFDITTLLTNNTSITSIKRDTDFNSGHNDANSSYQSNTIFNLPDCSSTEVLNYGINNAVCEANYSVQSFTYDQVGLDNESSNCHLSHYGINKDLIMETPSDISRKQVDFSMDCSEFLGKLDGSESNPVTNAKNSKSICVSDGNGYIKLEQSNKDDNQQDSANLNINIEKSCLKKKKVSYGGLYCKLCEQYFAQVKTVLRHYNAAHGFDFKENKEFFHSLGQLDEFLDKQQKTSYYTLTMTNSKEECGFKKTYYKCNYKKNDRRMCPAFITSTSYKKNHITVQFNLDHVHNSDWIHVAVPPFYKNMIINKLQMGVSVDHIYDNIISEFNEKDVRREGLITRRYIHYLKDKLFCDKRMFMEDSENTRHFLFNILSEKIKMLIYKDTSEELVGSNLDKDDFIISFSTGEMAKSFEKHSGKGVLFDSTHSTTRYGILLIVGLVIDENQKGFPFIFVLTNSERTDLLKYCFKKFKKQVSGFKTPAFLMSDCYNGFYNAWINEFDKETKHLWCIYHVKKSLFNTFCTEHFF